MVNRGEGEGGKEGKEGEGERGREERGTGEGGRRWGRETKEMASEK